MNSLSFAGVLFKNKGRSNLITSGLTFVGLNLNVVSNPIPASILRSEKISFKLSLFIFSLVMVPASANKYEFIFNF